MRPEARKEMWQGGVKRCFFCTPQTFWNDVKRGALWAGWLCSGGVCEECMSAGGSGARTVWKEVLAGHRSQHWSLCLLAF